jgi:predicted  nucleic acid-binding Zn-ribbon protein
MELEKLRMIRAEMAEIKADVTHESGVISQTLVSIHSDIRGLKREVASLNARFENLNDAVDAHTYRLERIEKRLRRAGIFGEFLRTS